MNYTITPTIKEYAQAINALRKLGYSWENRNIDTTLNDIGILDEENYFMNGIETVVFFDVNSKIVYFGNVNELGHDDIEFDDILTLK